MAIGFFKKLVSWGKKIVQPIRKVVSTVYNRVLKPGSQIALNVVKNIPIPGVGEVAKKVVETVAPVAYAVNDKIYGTKQGKDYW